MKSRVKEKFLRIRKIGVDLYSKRKKKERTYRATSRRREDSRSQVEGSLWNR